MHTWIRATLLAVASLANLSCSRQSTKYLQLDATLQIDNHRYVISYNWNCHQELHGVGEYLFILPLPASGKYEWVWESSAAQLLKMKLDDDTYVVLEPPRDVSCMTDFVGQRRYEGVSPQIVKTVASAPIGWESFDSDHDRSIDHSVKIESAVVTRLRQRHADSPVDLSSLIQSIDRLPIAYQSVTASVIPTQEVFFWSIPIDEYFEKARGIVVAGPGTNRGAGRGYEDLRFFKVWQDRGDPRQIDALARTHRVSLERDDAGMWHMPNSPDYREGLMYFTIPYHRDPATKQFDFVLDSGCPAANVDYRGIPIELKSVQQVYDTERKLLITFTNNCRSMPWFPSER